MKICIIGLGYIGLPTAALLSSKGHQVIGVDINKEAVDTINEGKIHIVEPGLESIVKNSVENGLLEARQIPTEADVFMICVPTPFHEHGDIPQPNLDYVVAATRAIAPYVRNGNLIILESTSPVGTTELVEETLKFCGVNSESLSIAYCPERVLPGKIMHELVANDRIVGGLNASATAAVASFYQTFVDGKVLKTDARTAEMCKLTENSFRDVNIAFANELSMICNKSNINVWELISLANHHPRVDILQPGCGVGGHCIAVDPWFIVAANPEQSKIIKTAREVNNSKSEWVIDQVTKLTNQLASSISHKPVIGCLGLSFKPDIDDLRESPALAITQKLQNLDFNVIAVEPNIKSFEGLILKQLEIAVKECDILVILVKHSSFLEQIALFENFNGKIIDCCGLIK